MAGPVRFIGESDSSINGSGNLHVTSQVNESIQYLNQHVYSKQKFDFLFCLSTISKIIQGEANDSDLEKFKEQFKILGQHVDSAKNDLPLLFNDDRHSEIIESVKLQDGNKVHEAIKKEIELMKDDWSIYLLLNAILDCEISKGLKPDEITDLSKPVFEAANKLSASFISILTSTDRKSEFTYRLCEFDKSWQLYREKTNEYWNVLSNKTEEEYSNQQAFIKRLIDNQTKALERHRSKGKERADTRADDAVIGEPAQKTKSDPSHTDSEIERILLPGGRELSIVPEHVSKSIQYLIMHLYDHDRGAFNFLCCYSNFSKISIYYGQEVKDQSLDYLKEQFNTLGMYIGFLLSGDRRPVRIEKIGSFDEGNEIHKIVEREINLLKDDWSLYLLLNAILIYEFSKNVPQDEITDLSKPVFAAASELVESFRVLLVGLDGEQDYKGIIVEFDKCWRLYREKINEYWNALSNKTQEEYEVQQAFITGLIENYSKNFQKSLERGKTKEGKPGGASEKDQVYAFELMKGFLLQKNIITFEKDDEDLALNLCVALYLFMKSSLKDKFLDTKILSSLSDVKDNHEDYLTILTLLRFLSESNVDFNAFKNPETVQKIFNCESEDLIACKHIITELSLEGRLDSLLTLFFERFVNNKTDEEMMVLFADDRFKNLDTAYNFILSLAAQAKPSFVKFLRIE